MFSRAVSNRDMRSRTASLIFVLFSCWLWAQHSYTNEEEEAAIERVKNLQASSLDRALPKVTLDFLLQYEGEGAPIKWRMSNCEQLSGKPVADPKRDPGVCVKAEIDLKENRSAVVVVSLGALTRRPRGVPAVFRITVTDQGGIRDIPRLSDLPLELHRPLPKLPRDLPFPVGAG